MEFLTNVIVNHLIWIAPTASSGESLSSVLFGTSMHWETRKVKSAYKMFHKWRIKTIASSKISYIDSRLFKLRDPLYIKPSFGLYQPTQLKNN